MAVESKRGCGYRKVGGIYLITEGGAWAGCDRLPYPLHSCPVCGAGVHLSRAMTQIDPVELLKVHDPCQDKPDVMCAPRDHVGFIMLVGAQFYPTPEDFMRESIEQGVSRRIPFVPKGMELGKTVVYLAHQRAIQGAPKITESDPYLLFGCPGIYSVKETKEFNYSLGIFATFVPARVEKLIWASEATPEELADLQRRGITPVIIPDGDPDHKPSTKAKKVVKVYSLPEPDQNEEEGEAEDDSD